MGREVAIEVRSLVKKYGNLAAVDGISFTVNRGEVFAFVGPNGAGKTTTVEILVCLRRSTDGEAKVLGFDISDKRGQLQIRKRAGVLPQDFNTFDLLTVGENLSYYRKMYDKGT
ncbi:ATP-binding cassette domain-containing protein, partial [Candidatus Bathyarchaeota archaeon]|nr:ATP-binding cassette domain-containing protein [Candidatus Bathyarchaeota archaeon]